MSSDPEVPRRCRQRRLPIAPLAPMALGVAAGIVLDRYGIEASTRAWSAFAVVAALLTVAACWRGPRWVSGACVLAAAVGVGGGWHHRKAVDREMDDLARFAWNEPQPVWLRGVLVEVPEFRPGQWPGDAGSTRTELAVTAICDGRRWQAASGRLLTYASGDRTDLAMGQPVEAAGTLQAIAGPLNPGEPDRRLWALAKGIRLRLSIDSVEGLQPDPTGTSWLRENWLGQLRSIAHKRLVASLPADVAPLAAALLLGRREAIDADINDAFARTGTMHLIAISGLHMQTLAILAGSVLMLAGVGRRRSALAILICTVAYAVLVGGMPSVVRSTTMTFILGAAVILDRRAWSANLLALAALVILGRNPLSLFDVGCQLSFLAVMALVWVVPPLGRAAGLRVARSWIDPQAKLTEAQTPRQRLDALERHYAGPWKKALYAAWDWLRLMLISSIAVEIATLPLVMLRFHLFSVIGIFLNIILIPLSFPTLGLAGLTLLWSLTGLATPSVLVWPAAWLLRLNMGIVRWGATIPGGHAFVASPPWHWVLGYYGLLALALLAIRADWRWRRWPVASLAAWSLLGIVAVLGTSRPDVPEAEFLAVDHGLSILVRSPGGQTLLYDCGRMRDPHIGRRVIAPALWERGARRIDTVILSHADADHYDGLPDLIDRFGIGEIRVPPGFIGNDNPGATALIANCLARGIPVRTLSAGARLDLGGLIVDALHPPGHWLRDAPDNDRSLVLDLSCDGRHLLLTGDLEGAGLAELLALPTRRWDAILAPHHGGRTANPPWLYDWAEPRLVLASQQRPLDPATDALAPLERQGVPVLRTWREGAVRVRWEAGGLSARGFREASQYQDLKFQMTDFRMLMITPWGHAFIGLLSFFAGLVGCAMLGIVEFGAWSLVTAGRRHDPTRPDREPSPWEPIAVEAADGVRLAGAWHSAANANGRTLLLLHGFAEDRAAMLGRAEALAARGWNVVAIDSRGRGQSGGDRTTFGGREADDLRAWAAALADRVGPELKLAAWGRSMGAAIALRASVEEPRLRAVVLEAPYPELTPTVAAWLRRWRLPGFLAPWMLHRAARLAGVPLASPRPIDLATRLNVPALILHGTRDTIAPLSDARRLADALAGPVQFVDVPDARHSDVFDVGGPPLAYRIAAFLDGAVRS